MVIEPMAILEPSYKAPQDKIAELKKELQMLLDTGIEKLSPALLQLAGYRFHETLIGFSNNPYFEISCVMSTACAVCWTIALWMTATATIPK